MKKIILLVCALLSAGFAHAMEDKHYDTMVVFGDSLSDNGNLYNYLWHTIPASPPYYLGQFSNGPVWVERLYDANFSKEYTQGMQNYAVGGAGAVIAPKQTLPYTLAMEVDNYLYWHTYGKKDSTLFAIWIGGNNYLNAPTNVDILTDSAVGAIGNAVERLVHAGGTKFFIANLPDLAKTPYVNEYGTRAIVSRLVTAHNEKLAIKVADLKDKYPDITIVYFDVFSFFNAALEHADDYGFTNTYEPCYLGGYIDWKAKELVNDATLKNYVTQLNPQFDTSSWASISQNPQVKEAVIASYLHQLASENNKEGILQCDNYVFWDRIHPSAKAHELIAEQAHHLLSEEGLAPVIPSTSPLSK